MYMKKLLFIFIYIITFAIAAQAQWVNSGPDYGNGKMRQNGNRIYLMGTRLYHSDDNGANWQVENTPAVNYNDLIFLPTKIIAATSKGLYVSYNNGTSWLSHNTGISSSDSSGNIVDIVQNGNRLLIVSQTGVYYSDNDGGSWTASIATTGLRSMAVINNTIITSKITGIWTSADNGLTFTATTNTGIVGANPNIRDLLVFNNELYCRKIGSLEIYKSSDDGLNWQLINVGITGSTALSLISINNKLFTTTDNNVYELNIGASNWVVSSLSTADTKYILHYNNSKYFAYNPIIAQMELTNDIGITWLIADINIFMQTISRLTTTSNNKLFSLAASVYQFDPNDSTWFRFIPYLYDFSGTVVTVPVGAVYSIVFGSGNQYYVATDGGVWRSNDNGVSWVQGATGLPVTSNNFNYKTVKDLYISGDTIIAATAVGIYRSLNQANTWQQVSTLNCADLHKYGNYLYATGNGVYRSADNGNTWTAFAGATSGGPFLYITGAGGKIFTSTIGGSPSSLTLYADTLASSFSTMTNYIGAGFGYGDFLFISKFYINTVLSINTLVDMTDNLPCYITQLGACQTAYLKENTVFGENLWLGTTGFSTYYRSLGDFGFPVTLTKETSTTIDMKVYPNPANDKLFVSGIKNDCKIIIYNNLGQSQQINSNLANNNGIDISNLTKGFYIYLIEEKLSGEMTTGKFIKE